VVPANAYLLLIDARLDPNDDRLVFGRMVQRLLDRLEITRPIRSNDNVSTNISHKKAQEAQNS
jgi:hypothetical protein